MLSEDVGLGKKGRRGVSISVACTAFRQPRGPASNFSGSDERCLNFLTADATGKEEAWRHAERGQAGWLIVDSGRLVRVPDFGVAGLSYRAVVVR